MVSLTAEEKRLAAGLGEPLAYGADVNSTEFWDTTTRNRDAEVCMVVRRPSGRLLTLRKTFYPPGVFRLLSGGIEPGEGIMEALGREVREETGLEVRVARYLAVVRYRAEEGGPIRFRTHAFLLEEQGGTLGALDPEERVEAFREVEVDDLPRLATMLTRLGASHSTDLDQRWDEWGRFRAVAPRAVHAAWSGSGGATAG